MSAQEWSQHTITIPLQYYMKQSTSVQKQQSKLMNNSTKLKITDKMALHKIVPEPNNIPCPSPINPILDPSHFNINDYHQLCSSVTSTFIQCTYELHICATDTIQLHIPVTILVPDALKKQQTQHIRQQLQQQTLNIVQQQQVYHYIYFLLNVIYLKSFFLFVSVILKK